ncbi:hypothetical protein M0R45_008332 [Rubus argutus]|uniref:Uncharacterized protein n=1 Tax=Rubus argutus TaxID=59490 RepID=A0AAW1Y1E8_RUBAR
MSSLPPIRSSPAPRLPCPATEALSLKLPLSGRTTFSRRRRSFHGVLSSCHTHRRADAPCVPPPHQSARACAAPAQSHVALPASSFAGDPSRDLPSPSPASLSSSASPRRRLLPSPIDFLSRPCSSLCRITSRQDPILPCRRLSCPATPTPSLTCAASLGVVSSSPSSQRSSIQVIDATA